MIAERKLKSFQIPYGSLPAPTSPPAPVQEDVTQALQVSQSQPRAPPPRTPAQRNSRAAPKPKGSSVKSKVAADSVTVSSSSSSFASSSKIPVEVRGGIESNEGGGTTEVMGRGFQDVRGREGI
mmetsp:Transcript_13033/g.45837  ORF Transcript_13033/g.45837 Transcript_13033/m.45837 type:complete len:124 (+) Transcript_13033:570-941(+)